MVRTVVPQNAETTSNDKISQYFQFPMTSMGLKAHRVPRIKNEKSKWCTSGKK